MSTNPLNRRDFHRLSATALGGVLAGSLAGCGGGVTPAKPVEESVTTTPPAAVEAPANAPEGAGENVAKAEVHLCRGLNECKGQGGGASAGKNECAGVGECATVKAHTCGGENDCKGLGGCGTTAGANECKGKGGCHVPLMDEAWKTVRKRFEDRMKEAKKKFGEAPPPAKA